jgi:hypothetical protein
MTINRYFQIRKLHLPATVGAAMLARLHHVTRDGRIVSIARRPSGDMRRVNLPPGCFQNCINRIVKP